MVVDALNINFPKDKIIFINPNFYYKNILEDISFYSFGILVESHFCIDFANLEYNLFNRILEDISFYSFSKLVESHFCIEFANLEYNLFNRIIEDISFYTSNFAKLDY